MVTVQRYLQLFWLPERLSIAITWLHWALQRSDWSDGIMLAKPLPDPLFFRALEHVGRMFQNLQHRLNVSIQV
jgi:hypothetical protein